MFARGDPSAAALFDYKVAAKWKDYEDTRFEDYVAPEPGMMVMERVQEEQ